MRKIYKGFSFGESKFLDFDFMEVEGANEKAEFLMSVQNKPVHMGLMESFGSEKDNQEREKDVTRLLNLKEQYAYHFAELVKIKAIQKEHQKFKELVSKKSRQMVDDMNRSETVKTLDDCLLMRIDCFTFRKLILPLIKEDLSMKLFCLQRLQIFQVGV